MLYIDTFCLMVGYIICTLALVRAVIDSVDDVVRRIYKLKRWASYVIYANMMIKPVITRDADHG